MANNLNLSVTLSAINKATGPLRQIMEGAGGVGRAMRETRDQLRGLQDQQKKLTAFRDMSRQSHATRNALRDKREELRQITSQLESTEGPTRRLTQQQERAQREVEKLSGEYRQNRDRVRELARELPAGAEGTRGFKQQQEALEEQIRQTNERLSRQKDALRRLGEANVAGRFNNMTGEVRRFGRNVVVAGGLAAGSIFGLANVTADLGDDIGKTAAKLGLQNSELQELRYAGERSGVATSTLDSSMLAFTKRLGEAAEGTGAAVRGYEALGLNAQALADMPVADAMDEVADAMALIENPTRRNAIAAQLYSRAGVGLVNMLKDGSAGLDDYAIAARETGYVLGDEAVAGSEDFKDALLDAQLSMKGVTNTIGAELLPAVVQVMREFTGWLRENRDQVQAFAREFGEKIRGAVPVIVELAQGVGEFAGTLANLTSRAAEMAGGFDNLAMILGGLFAAKMIMSVVMFGVSLVKAGSAIATFAMTIPKVAAAVKVLSVAFAATPIGWLIAGIAAVAGSAYLIYKYWEPIKAFFSGLWQQVKDAFGEGIGGVTRLLVNWSPLGLLYSGISSALGRLGIELPGSLSELGSKMIGGLSSSMNSAMGWVRQSADSVWSTVNDAFGDGIGGVSRLLINWSPLGLLYSAFTSTLERLGISVPENFRSLGGFIIDGLLGGLTEKLTALRERITSIASSVANWFKGVLGINSPSRVFEGFGVNIVEGMINGIGSMIGALRDQVMGMAGNIAGWVQDAMGSALDSLSNGANRAIQLGRETAAGLGQGIRDGANRATESAANLANGVTDTVRGWLDIHSPSRVFATIGGYISQGLGNGIEDDADGPVKQVRSIASHMRDAAAGLMLGAGVASPALALDIQTPTLPPLPTLDALHIERPELPALPELGALEIQRPALPEMPTLYSEAAKPEVPSLDALRIERPLLPALPKLSALEIQRPTLPEMPTLYSEVATPDMPSLDALRIERPTLPTLPKLSALEIQQPALPKMPTLHSEVATPETPTVDALQIERPALPTLDALGFQWPELPQFDPLRIDTSGIQIDARPPLQSHASQPSGGLVIHGGINIEINAAPGMDEQALARLVNAEVQRALRDAERRAQASHRSAFHDID